MPLDSLDCDGGRFTATDANCRDAAARVLGLKDVQEGDDNPRTRRADRMSERASAAADIDAFPVETKVADCGHRHDRERFVDLEVVDLIELPSGRLEQFLDR